MVLVFMLAVVVIAVLANYGPLQTYRGAQERLGQATAAVDTLEAEKAALQSELGRLTEAGYLESLAREELTYSRPGEDVYIVTPSEDTADSDTSSEPAHEPGPLERFLSALGGLF